MNDLENVENLGKCGECWKSSKVFENAENM